MNVDFAQAIRNMGTHVTKRAGSGHERFGTVVRQILPEVPAPKRRWRVDWPKVRGAERWLREEWAPMAGWEIIERRDIGNLTMSARVRRPPRHVSTVLPEGAPTGARHVHGVLLSHCAGYRNAPKATDVVGGIKSEAPNETESKAILSYVLEASENEVEAAWKAGEFALEHLMGCIDRIGNHESLRGLTSVRKWLVVEDAR